MTREEQSVKMGKRLKALREETPLNGKKMSHEKLKEKLKEIYGVEISRDSLMNYEVSDVNHSKFGTNLKMNVEYLNCLSSFYGVSTDYLLGRSDAKTANEDIQVACKTTGLSSDAIESLRFDHSQSKRRDIFAFEYVVNVYVMIEFDRLHAAVGRSHRNVTVVSVHRVVFAFYKFHATRS